MKKICLFINLLLSVGITAMAQQRNDTAFHAIKMSKDGVKTYSFQLLPSDYYAYNLGFFCKKELLVEKTIKFPLKFRLGSVAYCDAMENKNYKFVPVIQQP